MYVIACVKTNIYSCFEINNLGTEKPHGIMTVPDNQILLWSCQVLSQTYIFAKSPGNIENIPFIFKKFMNFRFENSF